LLASTARGALVSGLLWYGRPLQRLGLDDRRFAVRLVLALEAVPQVQELAREALQADADRSRLRRLGRAAGTVLQAALARAEGRPGPIQIPDPLPVPPWQWSLPSILAALLIAAFSV
jgi:energy-coupling factor transport system permease protein